MSYSLSQLDAIGDVDPVAEADVYLAYGRDLQAEEILKEAMRSSPERMAIRTKLLEVYAKRRDTKGFELLATQLFALTGGTRRGLGQGPGTRRSKSIPTTRCTSPAARRSSCTVATVADRRAARCQHDAAVGAAVAVAVRRRRAAGLPTTGRWRSTSTSTWAMPSATDGAVAARSDAVLRAACGAPA